MNKNNISKYFQEIKNNNVIAYYKITEDLHDNNEYLATYFKYPYRNSASFTKDIILTIKNGIASIERIFNNTIFNEISEEEFLRKFCEVNSLWLDKKSNELSKRRCLC